jgi:hypothetical protein
MSIRAWRANGQNDAGPQPHRRRKYAPESAIGQRRPSGEDADIGQPIAK